MPEKSISCMQLQKKCLHQNNTTLKLLHYSRSFAQFFDLFTLITTNVFTYLNLVSIYLFNKPKRNSHSHEYYYYYYYYDFVLIALFAYRLFEIELNDINRIKRIEMNVATILLLRTKGNIFIWFFSTCLFIYFIIFF